MKKVLKFFSNLYLLRKSSSRTLHLLHFFSKKKILNTNTPLPTKIFSNYILHMFNIVKSLFKDLYKRLLISFKDLYQEVFMYSNVDKKKIQKFLTIFHTNASIILVLLLFCYSSNLGLLCNMMNEEFEGILPKPLIIYHAFISD